LNVRHRAGSLEAVVQRNRLRNVAITAAILALLLAALAALVRYTRRAQNLAELQMQFVAGVSHELRTPLSVMRTAGHNLRQGRVANDPDRVQRYGELIEDESSKLTAIVEQVLRFANARAGRVIGAQEPVSIGAVIDDAIESGRRIIAGSKCVVNKNVPAGLPPVLGDRTSLKHAFQNLIDNAAKYGKMGDSIGITASSNGGPAEAVVEVRIRDHGRGIPADEIGQIFDPFFRGKAAVQEQIRGTGLGLNLAKRIIEAHRGTISVTSEEGKGTEFLVRLPAAEATA
jgi:signal transduction histidine kinase